MDTFYNSTTCLVVLIYWLLMINITYCILIKRRSIPSSMSWLLTIYIVPFVGIAIWFFFW